MTGVSKPTHVWLIERGETNSFSQVDAVRFNRGDAVDAFYKVARENKITLSDRVLDRLADPGKKMVIAYSGCDWIALTWYDAS